jgi:hypothetical protein
MAGPSITLGSQLHRLGKAQVKIDGAVVALVTLAAPDTSYHALLCRLPNLASGNHVIQIVPHDGWIVVDYIDVTDTEAAAPDSGGYTGPSVLPAGDYMVYPRHAPMKCLDAPAVTDKTTIDIYTPTPGRAQVWHITPLGQEHYRISPATAPGEALSALGQQDAAGGLYCGLYTYIGNPAQQWTLTPTDSGYYQLLFAGRLSPASTSRVRWRPTARRWSPIRTTSTAVAPASTSSSRSSG